MALGHFDASTGSATAGSMTDKFSDRIVQIYLIIWNIHSHPTTYSKVFTILFKKELFADKRKSVIFAFHNQWCFGRAVRHRSAKPATAVRFR